MCANEQPTSIKAFKFKTDKRTGKLILTKLVDKQLDKVVLPNDIDIIGEDAFRNATNLKQIVFNAGLSQIDEDAFCGCTALTSVEIPATVSAIEEDTFNGCTALSSVVIPASVLSIDEDAFYGCENLTEVIYLGSEDQWQQINIAQPNDCLLRADIKFRG